MKVLNESTNNKALFTDKDKAAWIADEPGTGAKYLAVFNTSDQKLITEEKAVWNSGLISKKTPTQSTTVDIDISGNKKLYLVVNDGGDKTDWDHANWIEPTLYKGNDSIKLTSLKWRKAKMANFLPWPPWSLAQTNQKQAVTVFLKKLIPKNFITG